MRERGDHVLAVSAGPHGDGRFQTVGDLTRHIFSAEKRYVERLSNRPLSDATSVPIDKIEPLFQFGEQSRADLLGFINAFPVQGWDVTQESVYGAKSLRPGDNPADPFFTSTDSQTDLR
jgi:hypothetical protein